MPQGKFLLVVTVLIFSFMVSFGDVFGNSKNIGSISSFFHPFRIWEVQQLMRMQAPAS
jgi:hypothetical protein